MDIVYSKLPFQIVLVSMHIHKQNIYMLSAKSTHDTNVVFIRQEI